MTDKHHHYQAWPANQDSVDQAINDAGQVGDDGWSPWVWIRMANGDLVLATYPCGGTYEAQEGVQDEDYVRAEKLGHAPGGVTTVSIDYGDYE